MESAMKEAFYKDAFSSHFNILRLAGQWALDTDSKLKKWLYFAFRCISFGFTGEVAMSGISDLYNSRDDFKKVAFNMCTTMLTSGIWVKNFLLVLSSERLDKLRFKLFKDCWFQKDPEDIALRKHFQKILGIYRKIFFVAAFTLLPLWLISSLATLFWGPRALPFPIWTPGDLDNDFHFALGFIYHATGASYIVLIVINADLGMFSILLQIAAQYQILAKNIAKINQIYATGPGDRTPFGKDINRQLMAHKARQILRTCLQRQLQLKEYVKELEDCYNKPMLMQLIAGFVLSIGNGLELIVVSINFSLKLSYQVGYSIIVIGDVFMCCTLSDLLFDQEEKIILSLYDIAWYDMDVDIRKDLKLMTLGAQKIKPLTAGKMFRMNLSMYLEMVKNIYSWLALFRQVFIKK